MQWDKFCKFAAEHLELGSLLQCHIGPPSLSMGDTHSEFTLRTWVERQVDYIAVRPFESLDLASTDSREREFEIIEVTYDCWLHIGGEEQPFTRCRGCCSDGDGTTVAQLLAGLQDWHGTYWALQPNRPLVFDAIVRRSKMWHPGQKYWHESLEIFYVPADFRAPQPA